MRIPYKLLYASLLICRRLGRWGRKTGLKLSYYYDRGAFPNLKNPQNISERILSAICKKDFIRLADYADKVKVYEYVTSKGLGHILLKHYAVWENTDDIDITNLPDKFVLKPNNGSGGHVFCRDKSSFDLPKAKKHLKENLKRAKDYFFEPHYLKIEPKVFAEELLDVGAGQIITDYKFYCIKGRVIGLLIAGQNSAGERKFVTVDLNWQRLPYTKEEFELRPTPPKPEHFNEMVEYSRILSKDFEFVRIDFYEHNGKVYFGELTFSPAGGLFYYYTTEALKALGNEYNK